MHIVQFGHYHFQSDQPGMSETQGAERRPDQQVLPGVNGFFDVNGTAPDSMAGDTINKRFYVTVDDVNDLQGAIDDLVGAMMQSPNDANEGTRLLIAQLPDLSKRCTWAKCTSARWTMEVVNVGNLWVGPVDIVWQRSVPEWWTYHDMLYLGDHHTWADVEAAGYIWGQGVVERALASPNESWTVTNSGNANVTDGIIEFDGGVTNPAIINKRTGHSIKWTGTLNNSERLTIYLGKRQAKRNGWPVEWPNITLGKVVPFELWPGDNTLTLTADSVGTCTVRFYFARTWY